jgi:protein-S-isoprenylcysteine O-methyltransferase Ste14
VSSPLFARAVLAFLALPGMVAFVVPALLLDADRSSRFDLVGLVPLLPGLVGLVWCVRSFYVEGKGTLAPWSPPRHLVVAGLYRFSRNPMYVSVVLILWGWAAALHSSTHAIYALAIMMAFHQRIVLGEEPWLARTHGDAWARYRAAVPRWLGRRGRL